MSDIRDDFLRSVVAGKLFADIGGLWGTASEKVSVAADAGAAAVTMLDILPQSHELWTAFRDRVGDLAVEQHSVNLDADDVAARFAGQFDVVHCSGVIYHCPNPLHTLRQLWQLTGEHLVLTAMVVPEVVESSVGELDLGEGGMRFVPYLNRPARDIVTAYFTEHGVHQMIGVDVDTIWDLDDYDPWWWLFTPSALRQMATVAGFELVDDGPFYGGLAHTFLLRRT